MAKENIALEKYGSLLNLLEDLDCPNIKKLGVADNATYRSIKSGKEFLHSIASTIRDSLDEKIHKSPYVSLLADESTDVSVQKNMVASARILDPETLVPSTHFLSDVKLSGGTGREIFSSLKEEVIEKKKKIDKSKIMSLGSDGAKVMTGEGEGVTGYFLREINPMAFNIHCIAHRLALCSSQAAEKVSFLKSFQETLTNLFYYFKRSSVRNDNLQKIQKVLDSPEIKVKEVHAVRWVAIFEAVEAMYRSIDALITFFVGISNKDASAKGYMVKLTELDFVHSLYMMMDVLPVITKLSLLFQRADLDLPLIPIAVRTCLADLDELLDHPEQLNGRDTYTSLLQKDIIHEDGKRYFHGHILKGKLTIDKIRNQFITNLKENINNRFPDNNIISSFSILGLKPITLLSDDELGDWGNEKLEVLIERFGKDQQAKPRKNYQEETVSSPAIIDPQEIRREWAVLKTLCRNEGYPRHSMSQLWGLINANHREAFPNLVILAQLALIAPTHTADCERAFSHQNLVKTSLRNRLSATVLDDILTVNIEGPEKMDFLKVLQTWTADGQRRLYSYKK